MTDENLTLEQSAARFIHTFKSSDIDAETRRHLKGLIKDQVALQIGSCDLPWSKQVRAFRKPRPGSSTIVGEKTKAAAADAAYLNATYGHGFEYDDFNGNAHPGCTVVPVAFAIGEEVGATLEEVVVAMVAGYETYVRIGKLGSPMLLNNGWQPHAVLSNFGAAAIAAKLYGLNEEQTFHALAIALSHAFGPTEYASTGGSIKRVHSGMGARNGIESAQLAHAGITGPRRFLTGKKGLYRNFCHTDVTDEARDIFAPGAPMQLKIMSFKAYCCCAATHAYIETMEKVRGKAQDVEAVDVRVQTMTNAIVGTTNAHVYQPRNIEELQYSLPAQMALSALGVGNGYKTHRAYLDGKLDLGPDSDAIKLAKKMKIEVVTDLDKKYPHFVADVTVKYRDGTSDHIFQERATGGPTKPFSPEQFSIKLNELTEDVVGRQQASQLFDMIDRLDPNTPIQKVTALLQR